MGEQCYFLPPVALTQIVCKILSRHTDQNGARVSSQCLHFREEVKSGVTSLKTQRLAVVPWPLRLSDGLPAPFEAVDA